MNTSIGDRNAKFGSSFDAFAASVIALFDRFDQHLTHMLIKRCSEPMELLLALVTSTLLFGTDNTKAGWPTLNFDPNTSLTMVTVFHIQEQNELHCWGMAQSKLSFFRSKPLPLFSSLEFGPCTNENEGVLLTMSDL